MISAPLLIGEDPAHIERLWQKMHIAMMGHGMPGTVGGGAIDRHRHGAMGHQRQGARRAGLDLLGGKMRDRIRIYSHANTPERRARLKERGIKAIKCGGVADPVRKVAALRDAVGDDMDIAIDLHGPPWLTPADAARLVRALEPYELLWVEDPIAPENIDGYRRIRDAAHVPLAAGERSATIFGERELIEQELVDVIQPDTGRAGGITQMKKIAAMAEAHHIHDGAAFGFARAGGGICGSASAGGDPQRAHPRAPRRRLGRPPPDDRAASATGRRLDRRSRWPGTWLRYRRGLRGALPQQRQCLGARKVPVPTIPEPTTSIVYVQTRQSRRTYFNR